MFKKKCKLQFYDFCHAANIINCIGGVIVTMLEDSSLGLVQTNYCKTGMCCFFNVLRSKNKDWFVRNQDNVSGGSDMSTCWLLFQWASTKKNPTKCVGLEQSRLHYHFIECTCNLFSPWYSWTNSVTKVSHSTL